MDCKTLNISKELTAKLQDVANEKNCMILSFIAPKPFRVSPVNYQYTSIWMSDFYEIENEIEKYKGNLPEKLHLIIHTPWWDVYATTKIAKYLRNLFKEIIVYVPYEAASGWTVLCLSANEIFMDDISNLTPIDPQVYYQNQRVAVWSYKKAITELYKKFKKNTMQEVPPPYTQMCSKLDPVILEEMNKIEMEAIMNAVGLLKTHMNKEAEWKKVIDIAFSLAMPDTTHDHIIDKKEAEKIWLNIKWANDDSDTFDTYKRLVKSLFEIEDVSNHVIISFIPNNIKKWQQKKEEK